ncbi:MAG: hypothetical protein IM638_02910 [Bacteroidetes bacterium]|nr:hypothetical protein [Bacteroidota bacterium]
MKYLLSAVLLLAGLQLAAQQAASVIPAQAIFVTQFSPGPVAADPQLQQQLHEQMFGSNAPFARINRYVEGTNSLEGPQRDSLFAFLKYVAVNPVNAGISATQPMCNYYDKRDTLELNAYVFVLDNSTRFLDWSAAHLFPRTKNVQRISRNGYTYIIHEHLAVVCNDKFGWLILPDYYHESSLLTYDYDGYDNIVAVEEYSDYEAKQRAIADSIRMADSVMAITAKQAAMEEYREESKRDSAYNAAAEAFNEKLYGRNYKMYDSIANTVMKDREQRRKKKQEIETSLEYDIEVKIDQLREQYIDKHTPDDLKIKKETGNNTRGESHYLLRDTEMPPQEVVMGEVMDVAAPDEPVPAMEEPGFRNGSGQGAAGNGDKETGQDVVVSQEEVANNFEAELQRAYEMTDALYYSGEYRNTERDSLVNRNLLVYLDEVMKLSPSQTISSEPHFAALEKEKYDAVYYVSYSRAIEQEWMREAKRNSYYDYYDALEENSSISRAARKKRKMEVVDSLFKASVWYGAGLTGGVRFNGANLNVTQQFFFNQSVTELTKGLFRGKVDKRLLRYVKTNPYSVIAVSANPESVIRLSSRAYREYIQLMVYSMSFGRSDFALANLTSLYRVFLDEDVMYNLFSGEAVFAVTDIVARTRTYSSYEYDDNFQYRMVEKTDTQLMPEFVFAAEIGRKEKLQEIINIGVRANVIVPFKNYYVFSQVPREFGFIYLAFRHGTLVVTNDSILANDFIGRGYSRSKALNRNERRELRKSPVAGWWDAERTRLTLQQRGEYQERRGRRSERISKITNRVMFRGRRGPGGSNQIEFNAVFTDDGLPDYGYIRVLRILRLMQNLDRSF